MRVAVTGANGFLGRHVVPALRVRGAEVTAAIRPGAQPQPWLAGVAMAECDIAAPPADVFARLGAPEALVHLAWGGLPNYRSLHHFESELPAQYRFLKTLVEAGLGHITVTGTCFEYGLREGALNETQPAEPTNPYGFAKDALRRHLEFLKDAHPFSLSWARLFYMYGEGQAANSLLPQLERAIAAGEPSFNMSLGEQLRDYLPVETIAAHLVDLTLARSDTNVVNVCSGEPIAVGALVERWVAERGSAITLNRGFYPYSDLEPMAFWGIAASLTMF